MLLFTTYDDNEHQMPTYSLFENDKFHKNKNKINSFVSVCFRCKPAGKCKK